MFLVPKPVLSETEDRKLTDDHVSRCYAALSMAFSVAVTFAES
jgi:hypothetical protein